MNAVSKAAQLLGKMAKGKPKCYSKEEREKRRKRLAEFRKRRWTKYHDRKDAKAKAE